MKNPNSWEEPPEDEFPPDYDEDAFGDYNEWWKQMDDEMQERECEEIAYEKLLRLMDKHNMIMQDIINRGDWDD